MTPDVFWIPGPWTGQLAIVNRPRGGDWLDDEVRGWRGAGIDVIVSLLETHELAQLDLVAEHRLSESEGLEYISFPIPDRGVPSKHEAITVLKEIASFLERGKNVAIHCRQGIGRSGLMAIGTMMVSGVGVERALEIVSSARGLAVPETADQLEWIRSLPAEDMVAR